MLDRCAMNVRTGRTAGALLVALAWGAVLPMACRDFSGARTAAGSGGSAGARDDEVGGDHLGGTVASDAEAGAPPVDPGGAGGAGSGGVLGEAGAGPSVRAPETFDNVALWLEATTALCPPDGNDRVARCTDQSGTGNHATQSEPLYRPVLTSSRINGHATLQFSSDLVMQPENALYLEGAYLAVKDDDSLRFGTQDFAYLVVAAWRNSPDRDGFRYYGYGRIVSKQAVSKPFDGFAMLANYPAGLDPEAPLTTRLVVQAEASETFVLSDSKQLNNGRFRVCTAARIGDELALRINGVEESTERLSPSLDFSVPGAHLLIGGSSSEALDGDIAELVVLRGPTATDDLAALEQHLLVKYGL